MSRITPSLWFNNNLEEAMDFYASVFPDTKIFGTTRYTEGGMGTPGTVMTGDFEILGQRFNAINGGDYFKFSEATSFIIDCKDQAEVDHYWEKLPADGGAESQCGWVKDKFGVSWQIVPRALYETVTGKDPAGAQRATQAMLKMQKLIIADLEKAYRGE
ncbi:VOC family protein [Pelagibacterium luteolum]|uniref:Glyoxalase superfamily enzyme, possibly 3-demethylubiquinone-9 3-methyltransferase n=1 Tax=Pelagibacterium luteolum TaxID=440168 RepID=A0A1G7UVD8_9HYPH|nr:VOC family protein [Pelagibacterium luteolum]SDG51493.1 Glyoxalase superfamily enzyme, possibly 3-demethylubiquinone-9 3-methyltransferase [Pelagibacterium luteolum]